MWVLLQKKNHKHWQYETRCGCFFVWYKATQMVTAGEYVRFEWLNSKKVLTTTTMTL